jgi:hypothetical protein
MAVFQSIMVLQAAVPLTGGAVSRIPFMAIHTGLFKPMQNSDKTMKAIISDNGKISLTSCNF